MKDAPGPGERTLDMAVAQEVAGFRWVVWDRAALAGAPVGREGRFLAGPDDLMARFHKPCGPGVRPADDSLMRVPRFAESLDDAMRAAERVGLFAEGGAVLARDGDDAWLVRLAAGDVEVRAPGAAEAVCRAALLWVRGPSGA